MKNAKANELKILLGIDIEDIIAEVKADKDVNKDEEAKAALARAEVEAKAEVEKEQNQPLIKKSLKVVKRPGFDDIREIGHDEINQTGQETSILGRLGTFGKIGNMFRGNNKGKDYIPQ